MHATELIRTTANGWPVDLYRPPVDGAVPAVLWLHGGALIGGGRSDLPSAQLERYLNAGIAVASLGYPLAPESSLDDILHAVVAAWAWTADEGAVRYRLDAGRLAVVGHSAGGYLALQCGPRLSPRPRAIVAFYGYGDIAAPWYTMPSERYRREPLVGRAAALDIIAATTPTSTDLAPRMNFYLHCRQYGTWVQEVARLDPLKDRAILERYCPIRHLTADHPPTLLLHGDADDDVPVSESIQMAAALSASGVRNELRVVPGAGHGFDLASEDPRALGAIDDAVRFLASELA